MPEAMEGPPGEKKPEQPGQAGPHGRENIRERGSGGGVHQDDGAGAVLEAGNRIFKEGEIAEGRLILEGRFEVGEIIYGRRARIEKERDGPAEAVRKPVAGVAFYSRACERGGRGNAWDGGAHVIHLEADGRGAGDGGGAGRFGA